MTSTRLTHLGHSCVLLEMAGERGGSKVLLDPGTLTPPLAPIHELDAVLVTHVHPDHIDPAQLERLAAAGPVVVYGAAELSQVLPGWSGKFSAIAEGRMQIANVPVDVTSQPHEEIYPGLPLPGNFAFMIANQVFAPGDSLIRPDFAVDTLLLPIGGPWMKLSEAIDYVRDVEPRVAIPVHDGGLATAHREFHLAIIEKFAPATTTVLRPQPGVPVTL